MEKTIVCVVGLDESALESTMSNDLALAVVPSPAAPLAPIGEPHPSSVPIAQHPLASVHPHSSPGVLV
ncbi:hypothetical protein SUGI_0242080 [Cryptomeria japonica]|nr:hypothetical protein SUGI_0242080 [Cryptomeria japonica]